MILTYKKQSGRWKTAAYFSVPVPLPNSRSARVTSLNRIFFRIFVSPRLISTATRARRPTTTSTLSQFATKNLIISILKSSLYARTLQADFGTHPQPVNMYAALAARIVIFNRVCAAHSLVLAVPRAVAVQRPGILHPRPDAHFRRCCSICGIVCRSGRLRCSCGKLLSIRNPWSFSSMAFLDVSLCGMPLSNKKHMNLVFQKNSRAHGKPCARAFHYRFFSLAFRVLSISPDCPPNCPQAAGSPPPWLPQR